MKNIVQSNCILRVGWICHTRRSTVSSSLIRFLNIEIQDVISNFPIHVASLFVHVIIEVYCSNSFRRNCVIVRFLGGINYCLLGIYIVLSVFDTRLLFSKNSICLVLFCQSTVISVLGCGKLLLLCV